VKRFFGLIQPLEYRKKGSKVFSFWTIFNRVSNCQFQFVFRRLAYSSYTQGAKKFFVKIIKKKYFIICSL
jgi:hypothetical protein